MFAAIKKFFVKEEQDELEGTIIALARKNYGNERYGTRAINEIGTVRKTRKYSGLLDKVRYKAVYYIEWRHLDDNTMANSFSMDKQRMLSWLSDTETYLNLGYNDEQKKLLALMLTRPDYFEK